MIKESNNTSGGVRLSFHETSSIQRVGVLLVCHQCCRGYNHPPKFCLTLILEPPYQPSLAVCRAASTCSLSAFVCRICVSLCVRATICAIPFISSYCCCSSHASISKRCMFGSSCRVVRTSNDYSNTFVQSVIALLTSVIAVVITMARYSLTSGGVEGCAFNCSYVT